MNYIDETRFLYGELRTKDAPMPQQRYKVSIIDLEDGWTHLVHLNADSKLAAIEESLDSIYPDQKDWTQSAPELNFSWWGFICFLHDLSLDIDIEKV